MIGIFGGILSILYTIHKFFKSLLKPTEENSLAIKTIATKLDSHIETSVINSDKMDKIAAAVYRTDEKLNAHIQSSKEFRQDNKETMDKNSHTLNKVCEEVMALESRIDKIEDQIKKPSN